MANNSKTRKRNLTDLKEHPKQAGMFGEVPDQELSALAESMRKDGLQQPVEILPNGTIVAGHQRVRAAKLLAWSEIDVIVRNDLAEQGDAAVETRLIDDNLIRRQLTPLARARCILRKIEIERGGRIGSAAAKEQIKKAIAEQLQLTPRTLNRYLLALKAPIAVQRAFDRQEITLINTGKVAMQDKQTQDTIAKRIEAGEDAAIVVREHLANADVVTKRTLPKILRRFVSAIKRDLPVLGKCTEFDPRIIGRYFDVLEQAHAIIAELLRNCRQ